MNMIQDGTGSTSSMRIVMLLWFLLLLLGVGYLVITKGAFPDIPQSLVEITIFILAGKVGQSFAENKAPPNTPPSV